jgi:DNA (cytosine-5)-methyltransferase 1
MNKKITVGSDFSGVGAFDQALKRLKIKHKTVFACDMDKYARQTYIHNYGEPEYYPLNVYDRDIPIDPLTFYMTSPPCQAFSLAGKRLGKDDKRGILFFNSHEFIQKNKPRYFIFENVKGLLSDDDGKTFQEWINMLGGKSVNGLPVLFPYEDSVPYHIYWKVLNAKNHGVPQNRERVFIVGIRDDQDNDFRFPMEEHLTKRLKDVLEESVDEKYFLSDKGVDMVLKKDGVYTGINEDPVRCLTTRYAASISGTFLQIKSATPSGYEIAEEGDSINLMQPNSDTRRGRVGKQIAQTLDTGCYQGVMIVAYRGRYNKNKKIEQKLEINQEGTSNTLTSVNKDNMVIVGTWRTHKDGQGFRKIEDNNCPTIPARAREDGSGQPVIKAGYRIRRLTPRECFRLMDFPDSFSWPVSDSQAYKQAGNSIVVRVLEKIIKNLLHL